MEVTRTVKHALQGLSRVTETDTTGHPWLRCICVCLQAHVIVCLCAHVFACVACVHVCLHIYVHMYVHFLIYVWCSCVLMYVHVYACALWKELW